MAGKRAIKWIAISSSAILLAAGIGLVAVTTSIAKDNLSNDSFVRTHDFLPSHAGIVATTIQIPSNDLSLFGWWMPARAGAESEKANTTIILVHGLDSNASKPLRIWGPNLHAAGYSLLAFDLRNHGSSSDGANGYVTYGMDEADDVASAIAYVKNHAESLGINSSRIVLYGGSMGGATVLNVAAREIPGVVAVIADSSYASFTFEAHIDGDAQGYPRFIVNLVLRKMNAYAPSPPTHSRPDVALAGLKIPVLLAHCSNDGMVTRPNYDRLLVKAPQGTATWLGECSGGLNPENHLDAWVNPDYNNTVLLFLAEV